MQPGQLRMARAALNWSAADLARVSGVNRNTISSFEHNKYPGDREKLVTIKQALELAGVIFVDGDGEDSGVRLRMLRIGDVVRFRLRTHIRFYYSIDIAELGTIIGVESHPPPTAPTYKIEVQFPNVVVPYAYRFEYELVKAVSQAHIGIGNPHPTISTAKQLPRSR